MIKAKKKFFKLTNTHNFQRSGENFYRRVCCRPVTCGDIGEKASEVQASLDYNFQLAHKWGCVLLLDEAELVKSANRLDQH